MKRLSGSAFLATNGKFPSHVSMRTHCHASQLGGSYDVTQQASCGAGISQTVAQIDRGHNLCIDAEHCDKITDRR